MKTIVSVQEIDEFEIKPVAELAEWRRLVSEELTTRWKSAAGWVGGACPGCGRSARQPAFERGAFKYVECTSCGSLFAEHRPAEEALRAWYRDSKPAKYWRENILPASEDARREKIVRPRADWIIDGMAEYMPRASRLLDVSTNGRALIEEVLAAAAGLEAIAAGPTADLDGGASDRLAVRAVPTAQVGSLGPVDIVTAFDAFDRATDVAALVESLRAALTVGGLLFVALPVASGFEVQSLWEHSPTVAPPDKLNLPTVAGLFARFDAARWELLELSTPGMFDIDIIRHTMETRPEVRWPRSLRALLAADRSPPARQMFTEFLQSQRLTSFARLVARRKA